MKNDLLVVNNEMCCHTNYSGLFLFYRRLINKMYNEYKN